MCSDIFEEIVIKCQNKAHNQHFLNPPLRWIILAKCVVSIVVLFFCICLYFMYRNVFQKCTFTYELLLEVGFSISLIIFPFLSNAFPPLLATNIL